jgi:hypothetical protein
VHLGQNFLAEGLGDPSPVVSSSPVRGHDQTHWKTSAEPPADSMPFFSASARVLMWPYIEYYMQQVSDRREGIGGRHT